MVSRHSSTASSMSITRQCTISGANTGIVPSDDLGSYLGWKTSQNTFACADFLPPNFQLVSDTICRQGDLLGPRVSEEARTSEGSNMNLEGNKESCHRGFTSGQRQKLALSLNCHFPADSLINPSQLTRNDQWVKAQRSQNERMVQSTIDICMCSQNGSSMASFAGHLKNSRYLRAAQQLLDEVVCASNAGGNELDNPFKNGRQMQNTARALQPDQFLNFQDIQAAEIKRLSMKESDDDKGRTAKLLALLKELEHQYENYFHQMDGIVSKFELVAGTGASKSYIALTIKAMSLHFSNFRETIVSQLDTPRTPSLKVNRYCKNISKLNLSGQKHFSQTRGTQNLGMIPSRQIWRRPLRGLPENSVAILRTWLFEHFLHPYPNDDEKLVLSSQTGLTRNQISNWFINARVRLWKPMIEDMYREEFAEETNDFNT